MSFTVANILAGVQRTYSNLIVDDVVDYLNERRPKVLRTLRLRNTTQDIAPVADQREYTITLPMLGATSVEWIRSATQADVKPLIATNLETLDIVNPSWRNRTSAEPREYFFTDSGGTPKIGLFPPPPDSQTGGYPILRLHYLDCNTLTSGSTITDNLLSEKLYIDLVCMAYAEERVPDDVALRRDMFEKELADNEAYLKGMQANATSTRFRCKSRRVSAPT